MTDHNQQQAATKLHATELFDFLAKHHLSPSTLASLRLAMVNKEGYVRIPTKHSKIVYEVEQS